MKKLFTALCLSMLSMGAMAQFNTGSVELDASLKEINVEAKADFNLFKTDLSTDFNVSLARIDELKTKIGMEPAEIYLSLELGKIASKPLDEVVKVYQANKSKGWGVIAKELGIKPGSPEFHALKGNASKKKDKVKGKKGGNSASSGNGKGNGKK